MSAIPAILYGCAYYYEYLPCERLEEDFRMMREAGMNVIRIAESTWSTWEPEDGRFDFSLLHRVLEASRRHGLSVIIGTPTYAIPPWLYHKYPDIMSDTHNGVCRYGHRQSYDITHPGYLFHCERIIRRLMEEVKSYEHIIGFQLDNETKPYDTCSERAQALFREWLKKRFPSVEALNQEMGFAYWSNSVASFDELPDVRGTINASYGAEYEAFQRSLVTEFLSWQRAIVEEYRRPEQFVTHNFDFEWQLYSRGLQPEVDQFEAARALTIAGCDIYHPSAEDLTGAEIAFGGAVAYGLKEKNYLVLETQAQGNFGWLPYPGQLRLQALAHLASGAASVCYWHWHSTHNAIESFWKGVLSHDFSAGAVYREAQTIGQELSRLSPWLSGFRPARRAAILVSTRSQHGLKWFPTAHQQSADAGQSYSDYLRWFTDACYRRNLPYAIVNEDTRDFSDFDLVITPVLYSAEEDLIQALCAYVAEGGHLISSFKSFFADRYLKIYADAQPHGMNEVFGLRYDRFTQPKSVFLDSSREGLQGAPVSQWMELLEPADASTEILAAYHHPAWGGIPAVTLHPYGRGSAAYLGCYFSDSGLEALLSTLCERWGLPLPGVSYPLILREGVNAAGERIRFYLNFSEREQHIRLEEGGRELISGEELRPGDRIHLTAWDAKIFHLYACHPAAKLPAVFA